MTRLRSNQPWSYNLAATEKVRHQAIDDTDKRELLEMLGLVEPGSNVLCPDDVAEHALIDPGEYTREGTLRKVPERPGRGNTTPPGLATLQPRQAPTKPVKARTPAPTVTRAPGIGKGRKGQPIKHGTPYGAKAHRRRGELPVCEPCLAAERTARAENKAIQRGRVAQQRPPARCGSVGGFTKHQREKTPICRPCRDAKNEANRDLYARKRADSMARKAAEQAQNATDWAAEAPRSAPEWPEVATVPYELDDAVEAILAQAVGA